MIIDEYDFNKPEYTDSADIMDLNANVDTLSDILDNLKDTIEVLQDYIYTCQEDIDNLQTQINNIRVSGDYEWVSGQGYGATAYDQEYTGVISANPDDKISFGIHLPKKFDISKSFTLRASDSKVLIRQNGTYLCGTARNTYVPITSLQNFNKVVITNVDQYSLRVDIVFTSNISQAVYDEVVSITGKIYLQYDV